jgi:hypothetical protein
LKYPPTFSTDLQELSARYDWNAEDKAEFRKAFTDCQPMVHFLTVLAAAHRAGYEQCASNGFVRLETWCIDNGVGNPFDPDGGFDPAALDALAFTARVAV